MIRIALLIFVGSVVWLMGRIACQRAQEENTLPAMKEKGRFVQCAYCGTHVPERESIQRGDTHFCCEQHCRLYS